MGQQDILYFLKDQRRLNDKWFTIKQIKEELKIKGLSNGSIQGVASDLFKLASFNQIQAQGVGIWKHHKEFRAYKR